MVNIFPNFLNLKVDNEFINEIDNLIEPLKLNTNKAKIYSFKENNVIESKQRESYKISFKHNQIFEIINNRFISTLQHIFYKKFKNYYEISIGEQEFDYIQYKNGGYFEKHKDFVRINNNYFQQYTLLFGLSELNYYEGGSTILWFPLNDENKEDYNILKNNNDFTSLSKIFKKYNIPFYNFENLLDRRNLILNENLECIPMYFNVLKKGEALLFRSDIIHSGEKFWGNKEKELLMITINITGIEKFDYIYSLLNENEPIKIYNKFEHWMIDYSKNNKIIPFQIIKCRGIYNDKEFNDNYIRYWNFNKNIDVILQDDYINKNSLLINLSNTLQEVYNITKNKLNTRHRETLIDSEVVERNMDDLNEEIKSLLFFNNYFNSKEEIEIYFQTINNYINNLNFEEDNTFEKDDQTLKYNEKVLNTWEENGCNDNGDIYEDITYLNCKINILYGFYKVN